MARNINAAKRQKKQPAGKAKMSEEIPALHDEEWLDSAAKVALELEQEFEARGGSLEKLEKGDDNEARLAKYFILEKIAEKRVEAESEESILASFRKQAERELNKAQRRREKGNHRGGGGDKSWGLVFLGAIQAAIIAGIGIPRWAGEELWDIIELITTSEAENAWNDEKVFGNPYPKGKHRLKKGLDCMAQIEIRELMMDENFIKEHGFKNADTKDKIIAEILNERFQKLNLKARTVKEHRLAEERWLNAIVRAIVSHAKKNRIKIG